VSTSAGDAADASGPGPAAPGSAPQGPAAYAHAVASGPAEASAWTPGRVLATNLRAVTGRAYPRVRGSLREKSWIFFEIALPFLSTCAFVLVYRALKAPEAYIGFAVLGGAMTAFWLNVLWMMGAQLYWDRGEGNLEIYFTAPISLMSILVGMAIGGLYMSGTRALVIVVIGSLLFGVQYDIQQWLLLAVVFGLTLVALYGLGMLMASLFLFWGREAWHLANLFTEPVYFLGGMYAPVKVLGPLAGLVIGLLPLAVGIDAIRQLTFAQVTGLGVLPPAVEAGILVVMAVVFLLLARVALGYFERRARAEGRLVARWQ
jgi:ABC-2 type transport system permease protein